MSFHLHLSSFHGVSQLVLHTWEETLGGIFMADQLYVMMETIDGRPYEEEERHFSLPIHFLEDKQIFWRGGL